MEKLLTKTEHPIIFSGPMVRAILEDRKSQTRRVVKLQPKVELFPFIGADDKPTGEFAFVDHPRIISKHLLCPYGKPGDRLWVRETFKENIPPSGWIYRATDEATNAGDARPWKPAIHMPRTASRISLEISQVRVQRVQEIAKRTQLRKDVKAQNATVARDSSAM